MYEQLRLHLEFQESPVFDEVSAMTAVVRPILVGLLYALKEEVVNESGGRQNLKLLMLPRLRRPGDGDIGICFEYAVHDALNRKNPMVIERVADALCMCKCPGQDIASILFGAEKNGAVNLIDTASDLLTDSSELLYGAKGRPLRLKRHIALVAAAFRRPIARDFLPGSVSGLWKADIFAGNRDSDKWIGTTLKIHPRLLEGAKGLRLGIVPASEGESDKIHPDVVKNLIICPLPYDRSFMHVFFQAWEVVVQFLNADAKVPSENYLPRPPSRQVARYLADRRRFTIPDVIDALEPLAQPHLLRTQKQEAQIVQTRRVSTETTTTLLAPIPQETGQIMMTAEHVNQGDRE
jgi:hypothetical protein